MSELPEPTVRAGDYAGPPGEGASTNLWDDDALRAYGDERALLAVKAERERAARICEDLHADYEAGDYDGLDCAAAIRSLSDTPT